MSVLAPSSLPVGGASELPSLCVLDTNIVLDLLVFHDPAVQGLHADLESGALRWLASVVMRDELQRVLTYPRIAAHLLRVQMRASQVLAQMDALVQWVDAAPPVAVRCKDADDQKFIDLAVAHRAWLWSKDRAVLCLRKKLLPLGVRLEWPTSRPFALRNECDRP